LAFNKTLSGTRIFIEHAFGLFKGRFRSLASFGPFQEIQEVYKVIQALMVVHNFCIDNKDIPKEFREDGSLIEMLDRAGNNEGDIEVGGYGGVTLPNDELLATYETDGWHLQEGHAKRFRLLDRLFPLNHYI
jgi:hypothetical protein